MLKVPNPKDKVRIFIFILSKVFYYNFSSFSKIFYFPERKET